MKSNPCPLHLPPAPLKSPSQRLCCSFLSAPQFSTLSSVFKKLFDVPSGSPASFLTITPLRETHKPGQPFKQKRLVYSPPGLLHCCPSHLTFQLCSPRLLIPGTLSANPPREALDDSPPAAPSLFSHPSGFSQPGALSYLLCLICFVLISFSES